MPDSVREHNHAEFQKKSEAETAGTFEPIGVQRNLLIIGCFGKGRVVADRHYVSGREVRSGIGGGGSNCRGPELIDCLAGHGFNLPPQAYAGSTSLGTE